MVATRSAGGGGADGIVSKHQLDLRSSTTAPHPRNGCARAVSAGRFAVFTAWCCRRVLRRPATHHAATVSGVHETIAPTVAPLACVRTHGLLHGQRCGPRAAGVLPPRAGFALRPAHARARLSILFSRGWCGFFLGRRTLLSDAPRYCISGRPQCRRVACHQPHPVR
eukprot:855528-Prymnesium_polylepis.1